MSGTNTRKIISKGCIFHVFWVRNVEFEVFTLDSVPIVNEILDVFPNELPNIPPKRKIDFGIALLPDAQSISIFPYRIAQMELKELKEQLRDLFDKGFIR